MSKAAKCLISFGANIGNSAETIRQAVEQLRARLGSQLNSLQLSRFFRTPAVGGPVGQPPFVNAVAALEVKDCSSWDIWHVVRDIEHALGRVRIERWEARRIDLDVLMFDDQRIWTQHFKLPHPRMVMRRFILEPALDVAADWREPVSQMSIAELTHRLRAGPASLLLIGDERERGQTLMESAALKSGCQWLTPRLRATSTTPIAVTNSISSDQRWLGFIEQAIINKAATETPTSDNAVTEDAASVKTPKRFVLEPEPKLVFLLAGPVSISGVAWEDFHSKNAERLNMRYPQPLEHASRTSSSDVVDRHIHSTWPITGPRYLLATDDLQWAEHEIVSALDAMDCPVEPIHGT